MKKAGKTLSMDDRARRERTVLEQMIAAYPLAGWELRSSPGVMPAIWCAASPPAGDAVSFLVRADGHVRLALVQGAELREGQAWHPVEALDIAAYGQRRDAWQDAQRYAQLAWEDERRLGLASECVISPAAALAIWRKGWICARAWGAIRQDTCQMPHPHA